MVDGGEGEKNKQTTKNNTEWDTEKWAAVHNNNANSYTHLN